MDKTTPPDWSPQENRSQPAEWQSNHPYFGTGVKTLDCVSTARVKTVETTENYPKEIPALQVFFKGKYTDEKQETVTKFFDCLVPIPNYKHRREGVFYVHPQHREIVPRK